MAERQKREHEIPKCVNYRQLAPGKPFDPYSVLWPRDVQDKILFHSTLKPTTRNLLLGLAHLGYRQNNLEIPEPELARRLHMCERTVRSSLITLVKEGFVLPYSSRGKVTALQLAFHPLFDGLEPKATPAKVAGVPRQKLPHPPAKVAGDILIDKNSLFFTGSSANGKLLAVEESPAPEVLPAAPNGNPPPRRLPRFTIKNRTFGLQKVSEETWLKLLPTEQAAHEGTGKILANHLVDAADKMNDPDPKIAEASERDYNTACDKLGALGYECKTPITKKPLP